jgi:AraC-like DNA-binding protein
MAERTIKTYSYDHERDGRPPAHFAVEDIRLDIHCSATRDAVSDRYKIYWIMDGKGTYQIDFNTFEIDGAGVFCLSPGQVFMVQAEQVKSACVLSFDPEFYCVETHGKEIACNGLLFNNVHRATAVSLTPEQSSTIGQWVTSITDELDNKGNAHRDLLETYLRMIMIQILRHLHEMEENLGLEPIQNNQTVLDFVALVEKEHTQHHDVTYYADQLFISPKSLTRKLKQHGYPTPSQVIKDRLMIAAKRALRFGTAPIKEIGYDLGFDDPAYFSRFFAKAEGGITPQQYRDA